MADPRRQSGLVHSRHRVVVADDDRDVRTLLATALERAGYAVTLAHDGQQLYELLTSAEPGYFKAVVADHLMPRLLGTEVLARAGARAPFVIVTGVREPEVKSAAETYRAAAYFTKPVPIDELLEAIEDIVNATTPEGRRFRGLSN